MAFQFNKPQAKRDGDSAPSKGSQFLGEVKTALEECLHTMAEASEDYTVDDLTSAVWQVVEPALKQSWRNGQQASRQRWQKSGR